MLKKTRLYTSYKIKVIYNKRKLWQVLLKYSPKCVYVYTENVKFWNHFLHSYVRKIEKRNNINSQASFTAIDFF